MKTFNPCQWCAWLLALSVVSGCVLGPRAGPTDTPTDPWVPLLTPSRIAPLGSSALFPVTGSDPGSAGQAEGLALVVRELDAVARLVDHVSRLPPVPGRTTVNFGRIQADLQTVRSGLIEAILLPDALPGIGTALQGQYGE